MLQLARTEEEGAEATAAVANGGLLYFVSRRVCRPSVPFLLPPALRPPPARPPPPNQSRLHSVLQWSTFAVVVIASSVGQGLTALPRHFESS